jgi:hypothetical protein
MMRLGNLDLRGGLCPCVWERCSSDSCELKGRRMHWVEPFSAITNWICYNCATELSYTDITEQIGRLGTSNETTFFYLPGASNLDAIRAAAKSVIRQSEYTSQGDSLVRRNEAIGTGTVSLMDREGIVEQIRQLDNKKANSHNGPCDY